MIDCEFRRLCQVLADRDEQRRQLGVFAGNKAGLLYLEYVRPGKDYVWKTERKRRKTVKAKRTKQNR
jgi:hypothetical protein